MDEVIQDHCGWCVAYSLHDTYSFLRSLQHRGREAAGIGGVREDGKIDVVKWIGTLDRFSLNSLSQVFAQHTYRIWIGHVRYATAGRKEPAELLQDAHPHAIGGREIHKGNHIIILGCEAAIVHNGQVSHPSFDLESCDSPQLLRYYLRNGIEDALNNVRCAYSAAIAEHGKGVLAFRDVTGIRPGVIGVKDGRRCAASEDHALVVNGGRPVRDIIPGSVHYLDLEGGYHWKQVASSLPCYCMFEWQYLLGPNSVADGLSVRVHRESLGKQLAREFCPSDADFVTFLPESPESAARVYAYESGIPFLEGVFYKMRQDRAFQGSTPEDRVTSIRENLHLSPDMRAALEDKVVIVIDDSMVRANNIKRARDLLRNEAHVRKIYYVLYTPPIGLFDVHGRTRGCLYGVDMPPHDNFVIRGNERNLTEREISEKIGVEVKYISLEGMLQTFDRSGIKRENLCTYCVGGRGPDR